MKIDLRTIKPEARAEAIIRAAKVNEVFKNYKAGRATWREFHETDIACYDFVQANKIKGSN